MPQKNSKLMGSEKKRRIEQEKKKETFIGLAFVLIILLGLGGAAAYYVFSTSAPPGPSTTTPGSTGILNPTLTTCIDEGNLAMHIHVKLSIVINGQPITIPANVGVTVGCTRPLHTHDDSGEIHIESPVIYPFTIGDFFSVWGRPFDNTQILEYKIDSSHTVRMTVNGAAKAQFEDYVCHDGDQIQIIYTSFK